MVDPYPQFLSSCPTAATSRSGRLHGRGTALTSSPLVRLLRRCGSRERTCPLTSLNSSPLVRLLRPKGRPSRYRTRLPLNSSPLVRLLRQQSHSVAYRAFRVPQFLSSCPTAATSRSGRLHGRGTALTSSPLVRLLRRCGSRERTCPLTSLNSSPLVRLLRPKGRPSRYRTRLPLNSSPLVRLLRQQSHSVAYRAFRVPQFLSSCPTAATRP